MLQKYYIFVTLVKNIDTVKHNVLKYKYTRWKKFKCIILLKFKFSTFAVRQISSELYMFCSQEKIKMAGAGNP